MVRKDGEIWHTDPAALHDFGEGRLGVKPIASLQQRKEAARHCPSMPGHHRRTRRCNEGRHQHLTEQPKSSGGALHVGASSFHWTGHQSD